MRFGNIDASPASSREIAASSSTLGEIRREPRSTRAVARIKTKKPEREGGNVSALPDMSAPITLRQNRRIHHRVDGTQTIPGRFARASARIRVRVHVYVRQGPGTRVSPAPGYPGSSPRDNRGGISRDTDVTLRVTRVALTLSEICAGRYLSSWRFRTGLSWPQRFSSTRRPKEKKKKNKVSRLA